MSQMRERLLSFLAFLVIKVICKTINFKTINWSVHQKCKEEKQSFIYAFWHGRQFLLLGWNKDKSLVIMTSLSKDGRLQDKILKRLGHYTVPGSSSRGAVRGLVSMIRGMRKGYNASVTVDGPRGPLHEVKPGIIYLASKTNSVIIPLTSHAKKSYISKRAWDKYELPMPFSPAVVILGNPIHVPPKISEDMIEEKRREVEKTLRFITEQADKYYES